jgi:hypothetical protein
VSAHAEVVALGDIVGEDDAGVAANPGEDGEQDIALQGLRLVDFSYPRVPLDPNVRAISVPYMFGTVLDGGKQQPFPRLGPLGLGRARRSSMTSTDEPGLRHPLPPMDSMWPYEMPIYDIGVVDELSIIDHTFTLAWPDWLVLPAWPPGMRGSLMLPENYVSVSDSIWTWNATAVAEPPRRVGLSFIPSEPCIELPFEPRLTMMRATRVFVDGLRWVPPNWDRWYRR